MQAQERGDEVDECEWVNGRPDGPASGDSEWVNLDSQAESAERLSEEGEKEKVLESGENLSVEDLKNALERARNRIDTLETENDNLRRQAERSTNQADHYAAMAQTKEKELTNLQEQLSQHEQVRTILSHTEVLFAAGFRQAAGAGFVQN